MKLSIIIVNYNVKYFLEQCLHSVRKACIPVGNSEIFVVDNNSVDGSAEMVREKFPEINLVANDRNKGFSYANNQAIKIAKGEYVLLLNPDTIVEEDTFEKIVKFMDEHPDAGGLGVKMLDGKGNFLPESKRGLPTPKVAFYKMFGLSRIFPKSKTFNKYHLGYLDDDKIHEVDVLSGAFMLLRKDALKKVGLLDESFFMYGEDIDMSYRLSKAGYRNYYFPETRIIHYKGESTKKGSVNYVLMFYNAMIIFARKHFSPQNAKLLSLLINMAIYLRVSIAILNRFTQKILLPLIDASVLFGGMYFIKTFWEHNFRFIEGGAYPIEFITFIVPSYIVLWLTAVYLSGGYDKPVKLLKIIRGIALGTILILIIYALLPESWRFSRALILMGSAWAIISMPAFRLFLHLIKFKNFSIESEPNKKIVIIGGDEETSRVSNLLKQAAVNPVFIGWIYPNEGTDSIGSDYLGNLNQLKEIIGIYKIDEVIFCAKDMPAQQIIDQMARLGTPDVEYKIAPPESYYIIGSNSISTSGDLYVIDINSITKAANRRNKRMLDIVGSIVFIVSLWLLLPFIKNPYGLIKNIFFVLLGKKSWVGYTEMKNNNKEQKLPLIRKGVLNPTDILKKKAVDIATIKNLNMLYAKDYKVFNDLNIVWKGLKNIGRPAGRQVRN